MTTKGIRGAITIEENTKEALRGGTLELLNAMIEANDIKPHNISHAIFTLTKDLNADFPAKFARTELGWDEVAMMCYNELDVPGAIEKCLRLLIVLNCSENFTPRFVYLKGASNLRI